MSGRSCQAATVRFATPVRAAVSSWDIRRAAWSAPACLLVHPSMTVCRAGCAMGSVLDRQRGAGGEGLDLAGRAGHCQAGPRRDAVPGVELDVRRGVDDE